MKPIDPPSDATLLGYLCRRLHGACLREIAAEVWPHLAWRPMLRTDQSAAETLLPSGKTPAELLLEQLEGLVSAGHLRYLPRRRDEGEMLASVNFEAVRPLVPRSRGVEAFQ